MCINLINKVISKMINIHQLIIVLLLFLSVKFLSAQDNNSISSKVKDGNTFPIEQDIDGTLGKINPEITESLYERKSRYLQRPYGIRPFDMHMARRRKPFRNMPGDTYNGRVSPHFPMANSRLKYSNFRSRRPNKYRLYNLQNVNYPDYDFYNMEQNEPIEYDDMDDNFRESYNTAFQPKKNYRRKPGKDVVSLLPDSLETELTDSGRSSEVDVSLYGFDKHIPEMVGSFSGHKIRSRPRPLNHYKSIIPNGMDLQKQDATYRQILSMPHISSSRRENLLDVMLRNYQLMADREHENPYTIPKEEHVDYYNERHASDILRNSLKSGGHFHGKRSEDNDGKSSNVHDESSYLFSNFNNGNRVQNFVKRNKKPNGQHENMYSARYREEKPFENLFTKDNKLTISNQNSNNHNQNNNNYENYDNYNDEQSLSEIKDRKKSWENNNEKDYTDSEKLDQFNLEKSNLSSKDVKNVPEFRNKLSSNTDFIEYIAANEEKYSNSKSKPNANESSKMMKLPYYNHKLLIPEIDRDLEITFEQQRVNE